MGMDELNDDFLYLHADTICDQSIFEELVQLKADINLPVEYKVCDEEAMKVRSENGKIVEITKQIPLDFAEGEFIGIASFKKEMIPILKQKTKEALAEGKFASYFEEAIQRIVDENKEIEVKAIDTKGRFWAEIDFEEDYERAKKLLE